MQKKSLVKNYLYNFSYQILLLLVPLITTPYLSKVLGPEAIGQYGFTQSICTYFILFGTIGINMYGQREIAYIQNDEYRRSQVFFEIIILRFITVSLSLVIYILFFCNSALYSTLFIIQVIDIVAAAFDISWFYQGMEDFKKIVLRNFFVKIVGVFAIFYFVKGSSDLTIYIFCNSIFLILGHLSLWVCLKSFLKKVEIHNLNITRHIKPTIILFLPQIATQIYTVLDKTMIGQLSTMKEVGLYEQAQKIVKIGLSVVTALGTVMLPRMSNIFASGNKKKMIKLLDNSFQFALILSIPIMFGLISISQYFVPMFLGDGFLGSIQIVVFTCPIVVLISLSNVIGMQYLLPSKRQNMYTVSVVAGAVVNFVMNLLLIPTFSAVGAAVGTVCAELTVTMVQLYSIKEEYCIKNIFSISYKKIIAGFVMAICIYGILKLIEVNLFKLSIVIILGCGIYFLVLIVLKDKYIIKMIIKFKMYFKAKI